MPSNLERHPVHTALYKPVLVFGLPRTVFIVEMTTGAAFAYMLGAHLATVGFVLFLVLVLHPAVLYATGDDPDVLFIFFRSLGQKDYYAPQPGYRSPKAPVFTSIPKA